MESGLGSAGCVGVGGIMDSKASNIFNSTSGLDIDRLHCSYAKKLDRLVNSQANSALQMFTFSALEWSGLDGRPRCRMSVSVIP
jgi:hypothetical protein